MPGYPDGSRYLYRGQEERLEAAFMEFIDSFGYLAVGALILLENVFPPIPSEAILPLSGFLCVSSEMHLPIVVIAATIGSVLGAYVLYGIGRLLTRERLTRFFETRPMRLLGFKGDDVGKAVDWFDRRGQISVLICRFVPIVRSLISIPAGIAKMHLVKFTIYTMIGSAVWNSILCTLGYMAGNAWRTVTEQAEWVSDVALYVILAIVAVVAVLWIVKRIVPSIGERRAAKTAAETNGTGSENDSNDGRHAAGAAGRSASGSHSEAGRPDGGRHIRR